MSPRALRPVAAAALAALAIAGCASGPGPLTQRRTTVGTLKASVARLEAENEQFRTRLTESDKERGRLREQLSQERDATGELTARLDDARALLARQGIDDTPARPRQTARPAPAQEEDDEPTARTVPAGNRRAPRDAPFARIGGAPRAVEDDPDATRIDGESDPEPEPTGRVNEDDLPVSLPRSRSTRVESGRDPAPAADADSPLRWMPITTGAAEPTPRR
jgi:outer membrane murein-binding lipoprotein Lpp